MALDKYEEAYVCMGGDIDVAAEHAAAAHILIRRGDRTQPGFPHRLKKELDQALERITAARYHLEEFNKYKPEAQKSA